ncbi:putative disease resistance protein RGA3 [Lactuca sativa]|uniref:putative disease resistance protein RGA3 n=1 Tax=Lactuca sativa TaxID=4236 RepID=UPI0022B0478B|nr:putative disease resistance protein RGA3 [Lactuca sativa]
MTFNLFPLHIALTLSLSLSHRLTLAFSTVKMAEALVTIAAEGILKKVLTIAASEIAIAWGCEEKLSSLHRTLDLIRAKLSDAESQKGTQAVMVWLKQLKDVVDEADDVLDEVHYEMLRRQIKKPDRLSTKVSCLPILKKFSFRNEIGHKIQNINKTLLEIYTQANGLGLQNEHPAGSVPDGLYRETIPHPEEFKIVGRDDDVLRIIEFLTQSRKEEKLAVVPIVGMGGIGKTALAKLVYNDKRIVQHFRGCLDKCIFSLLLIAYCGGKLSFFSLSKHPLNVKAWLCVSVKVDIITLLAKIYESLVGKKPESDSKVNLIKSLEEKLGSKRYFLVLDDVWVEERPYWEEFRRCMLSVNSQNGSCILVTTRKLEIGTRDMIMDSYCLEGLSNDECWSIFRERAFVGGESPSPELEEIGREIVNKCGGLPLLLNVIGGMFANYSGPEKWLSIKNSKVWDLEEERDRFQKSLELSFDNLPNSIIKQCFVYCSIFEKDTVMEREELVRLWMALGLVQADEASNKEMEVVGNDIFQILVNNSLFQDVKRDEYGHITHCSMHDLVHDLLLSLSKHESLRLMGVKNDDIARIPQIKHLIFYQLYHELEGKICKFIERDTVARTLRTLFIEGEVEKNFSFERFKCMRILKLKGCHIDKLHDSIGELVHLRYLDLSNTEIHVLPESIGNLYHLQTLKLPYGFKQFPESMRNLISLRYFQGHIKIPTNIVGHLTSLRNLSSFTVLSSMGHGIEVLHHLNNLTGKLRICDLENVRSKEDAFKAGLSSKKNIYDIEFNWSEYNESANRNDKDVLEGLQPPRDVKTLTINKFSGDNFPDWTPLDNLMKISLSGCRNCLSLPMLEHLPHLRNLFLSNMDSLTCLRNSDVTGSTKPLFPSLRSLGLIHMKRLEKWIDGAPNSSKMISPVLESLSIRDCPKIVLLDESHPHPLNSLEIRACTGLVSIKSIQGLTSLETLVISRCDSLLGITNLPNQCHSLKTLKITYCSKLNSLPLKLFDCFAFLNKLKLGPFSQELDYLPSLKGIEKLRDHLHSLDLWGWDDWESMPEEIQHLTSLTRLQIHKFGIQELPMWLTNMSSIRHLLFHDCKGLDKETVKRGAPHEANFVSVNYSRVSINRDVN